MTITGSSFHENAKVFFGTNLAGNIHVVNANQITCTTPAKTTQDDVVDLKVENVDGQNDILSQIFTYQGSLYTDITSTNFPVTPSPLGNSLFDVDGDKDLDNVDTDAAFRGNRVYLNDGSGVFTQAPGNANLPSNGEGHSAIPGDLDNDGDMDLVIGWFFFGGSKVYRNDNGNFTDISSSSGVGNPGNIHGGALADVDQDGDLDLSFAVDGDNRLYINNGGNFQEEAKARGVNVKNYGISTVFADIDNDGDLDLLTTTVKIAQGTKIFQNDGTGHFTEITSTSGVNSITSETCCFGDIDNDGDLDLYQGGIAVYANDGNGNFSDITAQTGIIPNSPSLRSCMWADVNNDGYQDLWDKGKLWLNQGNLTFVDATAVANLGNLGDQQSTCFGDIDGDGDLDIKSGNRLIRNNSDNENYLIVWPIRQLNAVAHNAKVFVYRQGELGNKEHLLGYREVIMSTIRLSGSTPYAHFGLPSNQFVDVRVIFLDGTVKDLANVERGATIFVNQID